MSIDAFDDDIERQRREEYDDMMSGWAGAGAFQGSLHERRPTRPEASATFGSFEQMNAFNHGYRMCLNHMQSGSMKDMQREKDDE